MSHNMAAIETLCDRCLLLKGGTMVANGPTDQVIADYIASMAQWQTGTISLLHHPGRTGSSDHSMTSVTLAADGAEPASVMQMGGTLEVKVTFKSARPVLPVIGIVLKNSHGIAIFGVNNKFIASKQFEHTAMGTISCSMGDLPLLPGNYSV